MHAGAAVSDWCALDVARATNVAGTLAVRDTFPGARFVHVSSGSVYDPFRPSVRAREREAPVARYLDAYGTTKAEAERALARDVARHPERGAVVVLRPHAVYGPGDTTLLPRVEAAVRRGRLVLPGGGRVLQSLTHVDTLLAAAVRAALVLPDDAARATAPAVDHHEQVATRGCSSRTSPTPSRSCCATRSSTRCAAAAPTCGSSPSRSAPPGRSRARSRPSPGCCDALGRRASPGTR